MRIIHRLRRVMASGLLFVSLVSGQTLAGAQTRPAPARRQTPTPAAQPAPPSAQTPPAAPQDSSGGGAVAVALTARAGAQKMGGPFESGRLPEPMRRPPGGNDEAAAALAERVAARDDQSVSALVAAVLAAGFAVRDEQGGVTQTVEPGQGLAFDAWELAAAAKMYGEGRVVTLAELSDDLRLLPALKQVPLERLLLEGLRARAESDQPAPRFWARFIVELGRRAEYPSDLLSPSADPARLRLDPVQVALILRRLYGDLYALGRRGERASVESGDGAARGGETARGPRGTRRQPPRFVGASFHSDSLRFTDSTRLVRTSAARAPQGSPCSEMGRGDASTILDAAAVLTSLGWGQLLGYLDGLAVSGTSGAERYANFLNVANAILVYAKLIATYAALETEITVENPPLVRTTNAQPGQERRLRAKVTMDSGGSDKYNCVRTALNVATGIDFSLIGDGPLEGVEVNWKLDNPDHYSNRTGVVEANRPFVGFWNGGPRIQDAGTYAGAAGRAGVRVGDLTRTKTNKDGVAEIYLQGRPRVPNLPQPHMPVMKQALVRTTVKLKGGDVKGDAVDIAGQVLGGVGGLVTMPAELLYRIPWASTAEAAVPVKDWETCESDGWYGTLSSSWLTEIKHHTTFKTGSWKKHETRYSFEASIKLEGRSATASIEAEENMLSDQWADYGQITMERKASARYSGAVQATAYVSTEGRRWTAYFERPSMPGTYHTSGSRKCAPHLRCQQPAPSSGPWEPHRHIPGIEGDLDPQRPNEINETRTWKDADGNTVYTFTVRLKRCR